MPSSRLASGNPQSYDHSVQNGRRVIGLIHRGSPDDEEFVRDANRFCRLIEDAGHRPVILDPRKLTVGFTAGGWKMAYEGRLISVDGAILLSTFYAGRFGAALRSIEATGTMLLNPSSAVAISSDKWRTFAVLSSKGVPMTPARYAATLDDARRIARDIVYPVVVKNRFGSSGAQVEEASGEHEIDEIYRLVSPDGSPVMIEPKLDFGQMHKRVITLDGRYRKSFLFKNPHDWRSNVAKGAETHKTVVTPTELRVAQRAAYVSGLRLAGHDIGVVQTDSDLENRPPKGTVLLIETNSVPEIVVGEEFDNIDLAGPVFDSFMDRLDAQMLALPAVTDDPPFGPLLERTPFSEGFN